MGRALRSLGVLEPKGYTDWSAQWPADDAGPAMGDGADGFYLDAPVPEEQTLRMALADRAMEVYTVMAAVTPIRRFSVACGSGGKGDCLVPDHSGAGGWEGPGPGGYFEQ